MAISHKDHDHPNTPAARARCRKEMSGQVDKSWAGHLGRAERAHAEAAGLVKPRKARISHKNCNHAETSAANAQCRSDREFATRTVRPPEVTVVPRRRGDGGVVQGLKNSKRPNTHLRADHDLADVPRMLAYGCRLAWAADLDVLVGDRFNDEEARIVIKADKGEISLVWRDKRPDGIWKIWVRNHDSSKQYPVESVQEALEIMAFDSEAWDEFGNLINP